MTPFEKKENTFILLGDIGRCFIRNWGLIFVVLILFLALGLFKAFTYPVKYKVCGTFKESKGMSEVNSSQLMQTIFTQISMGNPAQSHHILGSNFLLGQVVEDLGLQAFVTTETFLESKKQIMKENWLIQNNIPLENPDRFIFSDVKYDKEMTKNYHLMFLSPNEFEIQNVEKAVIAFGELGKSLSFDDVTLTLVKTPKNLKLHHSYPLTVEVAITVITNIQKEMIIRENLKNAMIYEIIFLHRDRKLAKAIINSLMKKYQNYLQIEADRIAMEQIAYLEKRKGECCFKMDKHLKDHVTYLKENLGTTGFLNLSQQLNVESNKKQNFLDRKNSITMEIDKLDDWNFDVQNIAMSEELADFQGELQEFKKQRDALNLSFLFGERHKIRKLSPPYIAPKHPLFLCREKLNELDSIEEKIILAESGDQEVIAFLFPSLFASINEYSNMRIKQQVQSHSFAKIVTPAVAELKMVRQRKFELENAMKEERLPLDLVNQVSGIEKEDLAFYMKHQLHLLALQENILKERQFYPWKMEESFQGIDLKTAREFYQNYLHTINQYKTKVRQLKFSKEHLEELDFEYISLIQILPDGISQQLARMMGELVQEMRDIKNFSDKEIERKREQFKKNQVNLKHHIDQTIELSHLEISLCEERVANIQAVILDLLNQEISLLDKQIKHRISQKKKALQTERKLIDYRLKEIEQSLVSVPDKWLKEHQLQFSSDMNISMLENISRMVESKNIEHNLIQVQSKPIDWAYSTLQPIPARIIIFAVVGIFIGFLLGYGIALIIEFSRGFPLSLKNLKLQGRLVCGKFERRIKYHYLDGIKSQNLQVLRMLSASIPKHLSGCVMTLLTGKGNDYSRLFAELLTKEGKQVLHLDLSEVTKETVGLFAYLNGDEKHFSVKKQGVLDHIPMGQHSHFSIELLKRPLFQKFLTDQKKKYDVIVIQAPFLPETPEGRYFMTFSDWMSLTLKNESNNILEPYYAWEETGKVLAFVVN